jgi:large repetitive protein
VQELQISVSNAAIMPLQITTGATRRVTVPVFPTAGPGQTVTVTARAVDIYGKAGPSIVVHHPIVDGVAPAITTFEPTGNQTVLVNSEIPVSISTSDAFGLAAVDVLLSGAINATNSFPFTVGMAAYIDTMNIAIPAGLQPYGTNIQVRARVTDQSGFTTTTPARTWNIFDGGPPGVLVLHPLELNLLQPGETMVFHIALSDDVGVVETRLEFSGAMTNTVVTTYATPTNGVVTIPVQLPAQPLSSQLSVVARALDGLGQMDASLQSRTYTIDFAVSTPFTRIFDVESSAENPERITLHYTTDAVPFDFGHVELYFRRNGIGTFNRYINPDDGEYGFYPDQTGEIVFDATRMGGDGFYEFYTVGTDELGNRERAPQDGNGEVDPDATYTFSTGTVWKVINEFTWILQGPEFENQNIRIDGARAIFTGPVVLHNVEIINGGRLEHGITTGPSGDSALSINVTAWSVFIDEDSFIDVSGLGYPGGFSKGNNVPQGRTGASSGPVATFPSAGSYGGPGGTMDNSTAGATFGTPDDPQHPGAGGRAGSSNESGGDGGGHIRLNVINLANDGLIAANGTSGQGGAAGSGSGGSIYIEAKSVAGRGQIRANGGTGEVGGGGGRVALITVDMHNLQESQLQARGGEALALGEAFPPFEAGGAHGSVWIGRMEGTTPEYRTSIIFDGHFQARKATPFTLPSNDGRIDDVYLRNGANVEIPTLATAWYLPIDRNVRLANGSTLSHGPQHRVAMQIDLLEMDETSKIDVSGKGYYGGWQGNNNQPYGQSLYGYPGTSFAQGGSHGGVGGVRDGYRENVVYGHPAWPSDSGAGGHAGSSNERGGNGGGVVWIEAQRILLDGGIFANGKAGNGGESGSGAGGSVSIRSHLLQGSGLIEANGGGGEIGGGGGRILAAFGQLEDADFGEEFDHFTAYGGRADFPGSAGTLVIADYPSYSAGHLIIDDGLGASSQIPTPLPALGFVQIESVSFDTFYFRNYYKPFSGSLSGQLLQVDAEPWTQYSITWNDENSLSVDLSGVPGADPDFGLELLGLEGSEMYLMHIFDQLTVRGAATLLSADTLIVNDTVRVTEFSTITTHETATEGGDYGGNMVPSRLHLQADYIEIDQGSRIHVDGKGGPGPVRRATICPGASAVRWPHPRRGALMEDWASPFIRRAHRMGGLISRSRSVLEAGLARQPIGW